MMAKLLFPCPSHLDEFGAHGRRDFDNTTRSIVFRPGDCSSQAVNFPVFDDNVDEAAEGFIIVLDTEEPTKSSQVTFTSGLRTTLGRIYDNNRKQ